MVSLDQMNCFKQHITGSQLCQIDTTEECIYWQKYFASKSEQEEPLRLQIAPSAYAMWIPWWTMGPKRDNPTGNRKLRAEGTPAGSRNYC
ncbi:uncharacterized protein SPSK_05741 [Sporothrix schenckii 1099-18]|uniref:Uncharacterized protein n=1 Tax=Sporothrix schenckii 1099-18 TaxID=1397361 RepID=A0A0F2LY08_SPOSC|nr:uncharacterized protein SPSK_05741 [Sporothrix schenckii 1099-18]KJR80781.1 hypothetical protein SPSK_05741 [Sporothrix schenckii 1099-18]